MSTSDSNMQLIGTVLITFPRKQCVGITAEKAGFSRGAQLVFRTDASGKGDITITASSLEINRTPVGEISIGNTFAVKMPGPLSEYPAVTKGIQVFLKN
ncbi:hypothetical protein KKF61_06055 [Patescibacteria group bacterium]|nr:hypothetical protein [Patescibacteria group bacterium]MBU0964572.1 hypothetical protein [Patescibacteria group bacterium]